MSAPVADKALAERLARLLDHANPDVLGAGWPLKNAIYDAYRSGQLITLAEAQAMVAAERAIWTAALDPNETKAAYIGEVTMRIEIWGDNEDGDLQVSAHEVALDWNATKATMKMIAAQAEVIRAAATGTREGV